MHLELSLDLRKTDDTKEWLSSEGFIGGQDLKIKTCDYPLIGQNYVRLLI